MANVCSVSPPALCWQPTLIGALATEVGFDASFRAARRILLDDTAWVDHVSGWVEAPASLFELVVAEAPWTRRTVRMYDRMVAEPRLTAWYRNPLDDTRLPPALACIARALGDRYSRAFDSVGAALYRDGCDSVAWHRDRIDPAVVDPVVAIVSLGSARVMRMRPRESRDGRRRSHSFQLLPGDLFVTGGLAQRTWEHSVPKVAGAGARISLQFRHSH